ncbi:uncharacterized protein [Haliotis asinina]|uniref:uncharacterized protein n=1 Tax=Haliotis asinina TaxID=109174 RepID=UPI0035321CFD
MEVKFPPSRNCDVMEVKFPPSSNCDVMEVKFPPSSNCDVMEVKFPPSSNCDVMEVKFPPSSNCDVMEVKFPPSSNCDVMEVKFPPRTTAKSFIADSTEFCKKISTLQEPGQLLSYDVVDLFTNVPRGEALTIIKSRVQDAHSTLHTHLSPNSIIDLINACISSTYFTWQDKINQQTHGLPMGSPLPPLITEICMTPLEESALLTSPIQPTCWYRKRENHTLTTSVYRKPTHTDQYIHFSSCHPIQVKSGVITTLTRRAKPISSTPELLEIELDHLSHAFTTCNEYPPSFVNLTIKSALHPTTKSPSQQSVPFTISIPYIGSTSQHIRRLLKQQASIDVTFQTGNTIQNLLQVTGRPVASQKPGPAGVVYHTECDCGDFYAGETSRPLINRLKEHQTSVTKQDSKSAIADHIRDHPNHPINWNNFKILEKNQSDDKIRKLLETLHIMKIEPAINRDEGYQIPLAYHHLIK